MKTILEHTKVIGNLEKNKIDLQFVRKFNLQDLLMSCKRIENNNINNELYEKNLAIQEEIIRDQIFIDYIVEMKKHNIKLQRIESLCSKLQDKNEKISNYSLEVVIQILKNENIIEEAFYDYLKYFSNRIKDEKEQNIVANNLHYFYIQSKITMLDLTEQERELFFLEFMSNYNLIPVEHIKKVCAFLVQNQELKNIILFLFSHNLNIPLKLCQYELMHQNSKIIFEYIQKISKLVDNENMYKLLLRWVENGCSIYDFRILEQKLQGMQTDEIETVMYNRSSYINFIFGNKLNNLPLNMLNESKEDILIYAIGHNKKRFLQLIKENPQDFLNTSQRSILFEPDFYEKYINLNTLTLKNLQKLQTMYDYNSNLSYLNKNNYTFEEISLLYNIPNQYIRLYNYLLELKIDDRLLIIKQLIKKNLLLKAISDEELQKIAKMLKIQNLYCWLENDFKHIKGLSAENVINILLVYEEIIKFIPQIQNEIELLYVIRNLNKIQKYDKLESIKNDIENLDEAWKELARKMDFNKQFIKDNKEHIDNFLLKNGAELALTYCKNNPHEQYTFKKILKAELMGQFSKLKYFRDDLHREIDFNLKTQQIDEWTLYNREVLEKGIEVKEYDDFYSTMVLGESPQHTCLSYRNGMYNQCLMACFDSNKKILYAKINDKIVARAMVRLTKGTYSNYHEEKELSFVDLENIQKNIKKEEYLTIFLEKPYISGVSLEEGEKIKKMFISLLETKAMNMNAVLVLSSKYSDVVNNDYIATKYYIYISKSKAGSQYLDSLSGENTIIDEGQYKGNTFMIWQNTKINNV